jgi:tRNA pseudouridine32 synthase
MVYDTASTPQQTTKGEVKVEVPGLRKVAPYWHAYATMAKQRWIGREILELVSTEFRDRSIEYYVRVYCVIS